MSEINHGAGCLPFTHSGDDRSRALPSAPTDGRGFIPLRSACPIRACAASSVSYFSDGSRNSSRFSTIHFMAGGRLRFPSSQTLGLRQVILVIYISPCTRVSFGFSAFTRCCCTLILIVQHSSPLISGPSLASE